jgi:hypothetical protein
METKLDLALKVKERHEVVSSYLEGLFMTTRKDQMMKKIFNTLHFPNLSMTNN